MLTSEYNTKLETFVPLGCLNSVQIKTQKLFIIMIAFKTKDQINLDLKWKTVVQFQIYFPHMLSVAPTYIKHAFCYTRPVGFPISPKMEAPSLLCSSA